MIILHGRVSIGSGKATSNIPQGLMYGAGENNEEHIPPGGVAVLGYQSGIDGEELVHVIVKHALSGTTSTYTGFWLDDDASDTVKESQQYAWLSRKARGRGPSWMLMGLMMPL